MRNGLALAIVVAALLPPLVSAGRPGGAPAAPPTVDFRVLDPANAWQETGSIVEGRPYAFDSRSTWDDGTPIANLTFRWDFGDGTILGPGRGRDGFLNVTHTYARYGGYSFVLTVTDESNETGFLARAFFVRADASAHPDISIISGVSTEPLQPVTGHHVAIRASIRNGQHQREARDLRAQLARIDRGRVTNMSADATRFLDVSGNILLSLPAEGVATVEVVWTPREFGVYSLQLRVWDRDEPEFWITSANQRTWSLGVRPDYELNTPVALVAVVAATVSATVTVLGGLRRLDRRRTRVD